MGLPNIFIEFKTAADNTIAKSQKGVVGLLLLDSAGSGGYSITEESEIPKGISQENKEYVQRAFLGYVNKPRKLVLYIHPEDAVDLQAGLEFMATQEIDYLVGPPDCTAEQAAEMKTWVLAQREQHRIPKAVLPGIAADSEAIVNFTTEELHSGYVTYTAAQYCSRIAGLITGTPMDISCTYAPLLELTDIKRLTTKQADEAIDNGEFILIHDGRKVKVARGVNSLKNTEQGKGDIFKKIKIVEAMDMIQYDLRLATEDTYIGKFANTYENKCILITAIKEYLLSLEDAGILKKGSSVVEIDVDSQKAYLKEQGAEVGSMDDQSVKEADTGTFVFLKITTKILDAIEDAIIKINV